MGLRAVWAGAELGVFAAPGFKWLVLGSLTLLSHRGKLVE